MKFIKKPIIVDAVQWYPGTQVDGVKEVEVQMVVETKLMYPFRNPTITSTTSEKIIAGLILTLEGAMYASPGDWIITGIKGEKWAVKPDIFELTYEEIKE